MRKVGLTRRQADVLAFITAYAAEHDDVPPTYQEISEHLGIKSKSGVHRLVCALEERGAISRIPGRARSFRPAGPNLAEVVGIDLAMKLRLAVVVEGTDPLTVLRRAVASHFGTPAGSIGAQP